MTLSDPQQVGENPRSYTAPDGVIGAKAYYDISSNVAGTWYPSITQDDET
jgi:hypothetical protein